MVTAYTMILTDVGELGLGQAVVQAEDLNEDQVSGLFWINTAVSFATAIVFVLLAPALVWFYDEPRLEPIAMVLAIAFVLKGLSSQHLGLLNRSMRFSAVAGIQMAATIISIAASIAIAWFGGGYWALVARRVVLHLVTTSGAWMLSGWRPRMKLRVEGTGPLVRYGLHCLGAQSVANFRQNLDKMLLGVRFGAQGLGLYERAQQMFVSPFNQLISPLTSVAVSTLSGLRGDPERYRRYCLRAIGLVAFAGMALSAVLTVSGQDLVLFLLGDNWAESGAIFVAFGPAIGMLLLSATQNWLHLSLGRADRSLRWNMVVAGVCVIGLQFGPVGVAAAYSTSLYVLFGPGFWYAGAPIDLRVSTVVGVVLPYFAAAVTSVGASWYLLYDSTWIAGSFADLGAVLRIVTASTLCGVTYLALTVVFHGGPVPLHNVAGLASDFFPKLRRAVQ
jgi:PST family polysaccharide transporter